LQGGGGEIGQARYVIQQLGENVTPGRVARPAGSLQRGHTVRLRKVDAFRVGARHGAMFKGLMLAVGQTGHQQQVGGKRVVLRKLAQPSCAVGEDGGAYRLAETRNGCVVETFDLATLEDTLQSRYS